MDNPNPIHYSDLIKPDNSIERLIAQLDELAAKYDDMKGKVQTSAQNLQKSMQGLSGATEEQRDAIAQSTVETDKLVAEYNDLYKAQMEAKNGAIALKAAQKEANQVTKLLQQINVSTEGSYNKLSAQYRLVKIRLNEMSEAERRGTESGRALEAEAKALYARMNELQKSTGKYTLQVGNYERALGGALGVNQTFVNLITDGQKRTEMFSGALGLLKSPIAGVIGAVGGVVAAVKLYRESLESTQTTGDAFHNEMAGWSAQWDLFKKAVATVDFSLFIRNAADAALAGRNLQAVLDEVFERTNSARLLRASMSVENAQREETLRDTRKSYAERLKAADKYLEAMHPIYEQEIETAKRVRDARLGYLFDITKQEKYATEEEEKAAAEEFATNIKRYNINEELIKQAQLYLDAQKKVEDYRRSAASGNPNYAAYFNSLIEAQRKIIKNTTDEAKAFAGFVAQYNLTADAEIQAYVEAEEKYQQARVAAYQDNKRIVTMRNNLEAQHTAEIQRNAAARAKATEDAAKAEAKASADAERQRAKDAAEAERQRQQDIAGARALRQSELQSIQLKVQLAKEGTDEELAYRLEAIEKQAEIEIEENRLKAENMQQDEEAIIAKYDEMALKTAADFYQKRAELAFKHYQDLEASEFALLDKNDRQKTIFRLQQEQARLQKVLELNETASQKLSDDEVATIKNTIARIGKEVESTGYKNIWEVMGVGLTGNQQGALDTAINSVVDSIGSVIDSWNKAADASVKSAQKQVESAEKVLDAEIEARNAGYAADVDTARKELALAKQNEAKALEEKKKAQQAQVALDTVTQASSLITASANIWASLSPVPIVGPALAIAAMATMWGSFALAKVKAFQVAGTETYGDGTVELLEGGSHASGHDIDMGVTKDGKRRRAEGGEFFAIINKRSSRKYRDVIPDVINSFNDGSFAEKYGQSAGLAMAFAGNDLTTLEREVTAIRKNGEERRYVDADGSLVVISRNTIRRIRK